MSVSRILLILSFGIMALSSVGCGTINTVGRPEHIVANHLEETGSYCREIPRVYSGVSYGLCKMYGAPAPIHSWQGTEGAVTMWMADLAISGVLDTLLLPYTIYQQNSHGSIILK